MEHASTQLPDCVPLYQAVQTPMEDSRPMSEDLASGLLWPDSEELLHNIMSIDPTLWQQPLALAPSTVGLLDTGEIGGYEDSPGGTIADDGRQAIQSLNSLLSDTVRHTPCYTSSLTVAAFHRHSPSKPHRSDLAVPRRQPAYVL